MNFIYVINLFIFCQSVIKFHFKRKYNPSNIDNSLKYDEYLTKNDLITEISIGTPNQKIPVSLIIDSDFLYLTIPSSLTAKICRHNTIAISFGILRSATCADSQYNPSPYLYA